ncbi:hypothetical protein J2T57_000402 [Natronocella acetinitrilica]|uniref:LysM domain-containing protein n=1 Tax=Natronocella acetinitrilica TaxID=414046 RepID=A0AAE3K9X1_9GAMM|nr:LysM peptidoglycan-binding domain-containing protein [Natronocella acetinitrilica]MCP1673310.1 hypothetical protein [Natronocella acetinitrilica]
MRIGKLLGLALGLMITIPVLVAAEAFREDHPERYTVVEGDTLWDISERFLRTPWVWPEIWHANPEIENPHLIYPGDVIRLVYIEGEPRLTVERGLREIRLAPGVREEALPDAIAAIPMEAIRPFLNRSHVVDGEFFNTAPYVVAGEDERVMAARDDRIYVRRLPAENGAGGYTLVRRGVAYRDPDTREVLGYEATYLGEMNVTREGDPGTGRVTTSTREILAGDRLLRMPREPSRTRFVPQAPEIEVDARIIHVMDGVNQIGQFNVVALNIGNDDGIRSGDVLAIYKAGRVVRDPETREQVTLPDERGGELIVFRTFDRVSYGLVMRANRHMNVLDLVRNP